MFEYCDKMVADFEKTIRHPIKTESSIYYTGVDLGTACVVLAVVDENYKPVAGAYEYADVVRHGMVVDYIGAIHIVRKLKEQLEKSLGRELLYAAANSLLKMENGAVVDIGGGTTGITILKDGKEVYVADEPTGGTHFSLVVSGAYKIPFEEAELLKRNPKKHKELLPVLKPVIEKVASIISRHIEGHLVEIIYLAGGTCCLDGIETIIEKQTKIPTYKPQNPMFVTPLGIALNCTVNEN